MTGIGGNLHLTATMDLAVELAAETTVKAAVPTIKDAITGGKGAEGLEAVGDLLPMIAPDAIFDLGGGFVGDDTKGPLGSGHDTILGLGKEAEGLSGKVL